MSQRMTDERLAEYEQLIKGWCPSSDPDDVCVELLQALKAERQEVKRLRKIIGEYSLALPRAERKLARLVEGLEEIQHEARECGSFQWIHDEAERLIKAARKGNRHAEALGKLP